MTEELIRGTRPARRMPYLLAVPEDITRVSIRQLSPNFSREFRPFLSLVEETTNGEETLETMEDAIRRGEYLAYGGYYDNVLKAIVVVSIMQCGIKRVLFINHLQGELFRYGFTSMGWNLLKSLAVCRECQAIRVRGRGHRWMDALNIDSEKADWIFDVCL